MNGASQANEPLDGEDDAFAEETNPDSIVLENVLDGFAEPDVPELGNAVTTSLLFPLLRGLVRSPVDFRIRLAAVQQLLAKETSLRAGDNTTVNRDDLDRMLQWLTPEFRQRTISGLQRWGWWHFENNSWRTSQAGLNLYRYLIPALESNDDSALWEAFTMANVSQDLGHDPIRALHALQRQLHLLLEEIQRANELFSSVLMKQLKAKVPQSIEFGEALLKFKVDLMTDPAVSEEVRKTHRVLSRLSKAASHMEKNLTVLESQQITLPENCTLDDITRALMIRDKEDLAAAVLPAIHRPYVPKTYLNASRIAYAADDYLSRTRDEPNQPDWNKPEEKTTMTSLSSEWLEDAQRLVKDLQAIPSDVSEIPLQEIVVGGSAHQSLLRLALLALMGNKEAKSGVAGDLAELPFRVETQEGMVTLYGKSISRISNGKIRRIKT